jgi:kynureninase
LREKSLRLTEYLMALVESELSDYGFSFDNPRQDARRGGHVALIHPDAVRICKALKARGVVPDYRAPKIIRLAPVPLYTSYGDVWEAVQRLKAIMEGEGYERYEAERGLVA